MSMMSFYSKLETQYASVPHDGNIQTLQFLEASRVSILPLLDILGKTAFSMVKMDVSGNIEKVRKKYNENPKAFHTLTAIIDHEIENDTTLCANSATDALIWLTRGLHFMCLFIQNLVEGRSSGEDITPCMTMAYDAALRKHHNWFVQKGVQLAFRAAPYYSDLLQALQGDSDQDTLIAEVRQYLASLQLHVATIDSMYVKRGLDPRPLS